MVTKVHKKDKDLPCNVGICCQVSGWFECCPWLMVFMCIWQLQINACETCTQLQYQITRVDFLPLCKVKGKAESTIVGKKSEVSLQAMTMTKVRLAKHKQGSSWDHKPAYNLDEQEVTVTEGILHPPSQGG